MTKTLLIAFAAFSWLFTSPETTYVPSEQYKDYDWDEFAYFQELMRTVRIYDPRAGHILELYGEYPYVDYEPLKTTYPEYLVNTFLRDHSELSQMELDHMMFYDTWIAYMNSTQLPHAFADMRISGWETEAATFYDGNSFWNTKQDDWVNAGVQGGVPTYEPWGAVITGSWGTLTGAISSAPANSTILFDGTIDITSDYNFPASKMLAGFSKTTSKLTSSMRLAQLQGINRNMIKLGAPGSLNVANNSGFFNFDYEYLFAGCDPDDDLTAGSATHPLPENYGKLHGNYQNNDTDGGNWNCRTLEDPDNSGTSDLHKGFFQSYSLNTWMINVRIEKSGGDPALFWGDYFTVIENVVYRAYNKGPQGNGYFYFTGARGIAAFNNVSRIRHFNVDGYGGSTNYPGEWNVIYKNILFRVDINLHDATGINNIFEKNAIAPEVQHHREGMSIMTGAVNSGQHAAPLNYSYFYDNDSSGAGEPNLTNADTVYRTDGTESVATLGPPVVDYDPGDPNDTFGFEPSGTAEPTNNYLYVGELLTTNQGGGGGPGPSPSGLSPTIPIYLNSHG